MEIGATDSVGARDGVTFTVWAPRHRSRRARASTIGDIADGAGAGRLLHADGRRRARRASATGSSSSDALRPDPASRYQPDGVFGPSAIVDPVVVPVDRRGLDRRAAPPSQRRLRDARRHVHDGRHVGRGASAAAAAGRPRRDDARDHAAGRVLRTVRLGLRRRVSLCAVSRVRHTR